MHASASVHLSRVLTFIISALFLAGCFGEGDGKERILGTAAPPEPPIPAGFCDPINFEDVCGPESFTNFEGGVITIADNPQANGINTSAKVGLAQKFRAESGATFGGTIIAVAGQNVPAGSSFTMKVWSQRPVNVLFKLEPFDPFVEREVLHGGTGWEELTFDFGNFAGDITGITLFFDNGTLGDAANDPDNWTFLVDDITLVPGGGGGPASVLPVDFEAAPASYDFGMDGGFGGGASDVIGNPDQSGLNTSAQTARMQKFAGEVFGGSTLSLGGDVDFTQGEAFTMKVWASRAVPVLFKFEGLEKERSVDHSGSSGWEELCFDFTGDTAGPASNAITFIFDLGVNGDATGDPNNWTFYYDDIEQVASCDGGPASVLPVDFEAAPASYDFGMDGGFGGGASDVIANPDQSGINTSAQTARMQKFAGEVFGGSTLSLGGDVDFTQGEAFTMKVWASRSVPVLFKFEGLEKERSVDHSGSSGWEELCFDFTGDTAGPASNAITFIFDLGVNGDATGDPNNWTFYYDDIEQVADCGGGGSAPTSTDFEGAGPFNFSDFGGGVATIIANPQANGINTSATVGQMQKFAGDTFGGSTLDLGGEVDFSAGEAYTMKVWSQRPVEVLFKLEGLGEERTASHGGTGWELLCFDFTGTTAGNPATAITLIFDNGTAGDAAGDPDNWTFYFDDIEQTSSCGGGSVLPIDFEGDPNSYVFRDGGGFGGGQASVVNNPDATGINTSAQTGQMLKFAGEVFGGATLDLGGTVDVPLNSAFTMKVWSQRAVPVLFKLEGGPVAERSQNHTGAGWEELCFDFAGVSGNGTDGITLIFDLGVNGAAETDPANWTFYFDDIAMTDPCPGGDTSVDIDFEDDGGPYTFNDFEGGVGNVIDNPNAGGINVSAKVAQMRKFAGAVFAGSTLTLPAAIDFSEGEAFTMKVWASRNVPVLFKLEGLNQERSVNQTGSSSWEELCFDFTGSTTGPASSAITFIFDLGTAGDAEGDPNNWTFYFDDIQQVASCGGGGGTAAVDFETASTGAGFTWAVFENDDNPPLAIVANPDTGGINGSATVGRFTARVTGEAFAGVETAHGDIGPLTLDANNSIIKVMVWKPVISDVGVKFAIADGGAQPEIKVANTVINQWEELTFDFSGNIGLFESIDIDQLIIFPDFDLAGRAQENVVYFDNVRYTDGT